TRIGLNQKQAVQALALAEAGLDHARNLVLSAGSENFDTWVANANNGAMVISGQELGGGTYAVRIDNDCSPNIVPAVLADTGCGANQDGNEKAALTAWATTATGGGWASGGAGRARVRVFVEYTNPWKHSCYSGNDQLCTDDQVPACANQNCVSPADPKDPNGPVKGQLPLPNDMRCGVGAGASQIPATLVPTDMVASMTLQNTCVIFPYYQWAIQTAAPTRRDCMGGNCQTQPGGTPAGTLPWTSDPLNPNFATCAANPSKCHGMVFFGTAANRATGADVTFGTAPPHNAACMGTQGEDSSRPCYQAGANSSVVVYVMGKASVTNNVEINGTLVLHGNGVPGSTGPNRDLTLSGTNRITTNPCTGGANTCGYPLAILAFDPYAPGGPPPNDADDPAPVYPTTGQSIHLDISNATSRINGIVFSGGTVDFNPITVNGGIVAYDINVNNAATSITYNETYGNAAPPPGFSVPGGGVFPVWARSSWIHCATYGDESGGPTACN
ncbi:MAG: hypothetical protein HYV61_01320, partial [Candidatus Rokubacteria bacterium]|nr:hypothetical protein [Candidatus Rokubacteria bacterium]